MNLDDFRSTSVGNLAENLNQARDWALFAIRECDPPLEWLNLLEKIISLNAEFRIAAGRLPALLCRGKKMIQAAGPR